MMICLMKKDIIPNGPVGQNLTLSRYGPGGIRGDKKPVILHRAKKKVATLTGRPFVV